MTQTRTVETVNIDEYTAISTTAALYNRPDAGVIQMTDNDRVDFLQRMTTNNIAALTPGQSTVTVLTSPVARNMFVFTVLCFEEKLLLLPASGETDALYKHLRSQIFFMDKVKIEDHSGVHRRIRLMGPNAESALSSLGIGTVPINPEDFGTTDSGELIAVNQQQFGIPGYELILPADQHQEIVEKLSAARIPTISDTVYHAQRIELGRPQSGSELTDDYSPLESGLAWACSENKGCYTGQEIIARQITYDKITKTLVGLHLSEPVEIGSEVRNEGKTKGRSIGTITSFTESPALGAPIALAVLKRPQNEVGTTVQIGNATAKVVALPFVA